jgi:hypothetical protein
MELGNGVYFIKTDPQGQLYHIQSAGCICNHHTATGSLVPLVSDNNKKMNVFNPDWWCGLWNLDGGYITERGMQSSIHGISIKSAIGSMSLYAYRTPPAIFAETVDALFELERVNISMLLPFLKKHKEYYTKKRLRNLFLKSAKSIMPSNVKKVELDGVFEEAYVPVIVTLFYDDIQFRGVITWQNSD